MAISTAQIKFDINKQATHYCMGCDQWVDRVVHDRVAVVGLRINCKSTKIIPNPFPNNLIPYVEVEYNR